MSLISEPSGKRSKLKVPRPAIIDGAYLFVAREWDDSLREAAGREPLLPQQPDAPLELIPLREAARRAGVCVRTLKRKIKETYGAPDGVRTDGALAKRALETE
jgi:hypothetical protein